MFTSVTWLTVVILCEICDEKDLQFVKRMMTRSMRPAGVTGEGEGKVVQVCRLLDVRCCCGCLHS